MKWKTTWDKFKKYLAYLVFKPYRGDHIYIPRCPKCEAKYSQFTDDSLRSIVYQKNVQRREIYYTCGATSVDWGEGFKIVRECKG